jgi:hypothetical protein
MRYAHLSPAHLSAAVDRLDGLIAPSKPVAQPTEQHKVLKSAASVA